MDEDVPCSYVAFNSYKWDDIACNLHHHGPHISWNPAVYSIFAAFYALAMWMALTLAIKTFIQFKQRRTIYFWSMLAVCLGIILATISFLVHVFLLPVQSPTYIIMYALAFPALMTGFALVLYSRLNLVTQNRTALRAVLIMIFIVAFLGHTHTFVEMIVVCIGRRQLAQRIYHYAACLEIIFAVQDCLLSGLYIFFFWGYANDIPDKFKAQLAMQIRLTFCLLILAYVFVMLSDILTNVFLFTKMYLPRLLCITPVYAIKLNIEFFVLNRLVYLSELKMAVLANPSMEISNSGPDSLRPHSLPDPLETLKKSDITAEVGVIKMNDG